MCVKSLIYKNDLNKPDELLKKDFYNLFINLLFHS
jgi:hypothetical protein